MKKKELEEVSEIQKALLKKALGYNADEIVEEYVVDEDGKERLSKKKITKKFISPDIPAAKVLLENYSDYSSKYENMSDEELMNEKIKLIKLLQVGEEDGN